MSREEKNTTAGKLSENIRQLMLRVKQVLLVDDDETFCFLMKRTAEEDFVCEIVSAPSVAAARHLLEAGHHFDAVILDARVTNGSGVRLFAEMKMRWPQIPIVFLTGYDSPDFRKEVEAVGPAPVFSKPSAMRVSFLEQLLSQFGIRRKAAVEP
jgi:DNA-binding NarL/FixJ family response regulator